MDVSASNGNYYYYCYTGVYYLYADCIKEVRKMNSIHNTLRYGHLVEVVEILDNMSIEQRTLQYLCATTTNLASKLRQAEINIGDLMLKIEELKNGKDILR